MKELNEQRKARMAEHRNAFAKWVKTRKVQVFQTAREVGINSDLKVGDKVDYCNDFGVVSEGHTVLGFRKPDNFLPDRVVYLDIDCYWSAVNVGNIIAR